MSYYFQLPYFSSPPVPVVQGQAQAYPPLAPQYVLVAVHPVHLLTLTAGFAPALPVGMPAHPFLPAVAGQPMNYPANIPAPSGPGIQQPGVQARGPPLVPPSPPFVPPAPPPSSSATAIDDTEEAASVSSADIDGMVGGSVGHPSTLPSAPASRAGDRVDGRPNGMVVRVVLYGDGPPGRPRRGLWTRISDEHFVDLPTATDLRAAAARAARTHFPPASPDAWFPSPMFLDPPSYTASAPQSGRNPGVNIAARVAEAALTVWLLRPGACLRMFCGAGGGGGPVGTPDVRQTLAVGRGPESSGGTDTPPSAADEEVVSELGDDEDDVLEESVDEEVEDVERDVQGEDDEESVAVDGQAVVLQVALAEARRQGLSVFLLVDAGSQGSSGEVLVEGHEALGGADSTLMTIPGTHV